MMLLLQIRWDYLFVVVDGINIILMLNKKVLLRERKRHTARRVASARYTGEGVPHPVMVGGIPPPQPRMGYPSPPKVKQTHTCENITSRRTYYVRGR